MVTKPIKSRVVGHQWRPIKAGVAKLLRVEDFVTVAEVHRLDVGFRAWFGLPSLETSRHDCKSMVEARKLVEDWLCAR